MARAKILIVEDSRAVATRLQSSLDRAGFVIEIARNGQEAWKKAQRTVFDVVITDEQMPVMSGQELCRKLRGDDRYANTPIIFLTASQSELDSAELTEDLRVCAILDKPFSPEVIVRLIENQLLAQRSN